MRQNYALPFQKEISFCLIDFERKRWKTSSNVAGKHNIMYIKSYADVLNSMIEFYIDKVSLFNNEINSF